MILSFPNMGPNFYAFKTLFTSLDIFDTFINLDFQKKLQDQGVEVLTIENMPECVFRKPTLCLT